MPRRLVLLLSIAALSLAGAPAAFAGTAGYSYAGISSRTAVYGVSTELTARTTTLPPAPRSTVAPAPAAAPRAGP